MFIPKHKNPAHKRDISRSREWKKLLRLKYDLDSLELDVDLMGDKLSSMIEKMKVEKEREPCFDKPLDEIYEDEKECHLEKSIEEILEVSKMETPFDSHVESKKELCFKEPVDEDEDDKGPCFDEPLEVVQENMVEDEESHVVSNEEEPCFDEPLEEVQVILDEDQGEANYFPSSPTEDKSCPLILVEESCVHEASKITKEKLMAMVVHHPSLISPHWSIGGKSMLVPSRCLTSLNIENHYDDDSLSGLASRIAYHVLVTIPWPFDRGATLEGKMLASSLGPNQKNTTPDHFKLPPTHNPKEPQPMKPPNTSLPCLYHVYPLEGIDKILPRELTSGPTPQRTTNHKISLVPYTSPTLLDLQVQDLVLGPLSERSRAEEHGMLVSHMRCRVRAHTKRNTTLVSSTKTAQHLTFPKTPFQNTHIALSLSRPLSNPLIKNNFGDALPLESLGGVKLRNDATRVSNEVVYYTEPWLCDPYMQWIKASVKKSELEGCLIPHEPKHAGHPYLWWMKALGEFHMVLVPTNTMLEGGRVSTSLQGGRTWATLDRPKVSMCEWIMMARSSPSLEDKDHILGECEDFKLKREPNEERAHSCLNDPSLEVAPTSKPHPNDVLENPLESLIQDKVEVLSQGGKQVGHYRSTKQGGKARGVMSRVLILPRVQTLKCQENDQAKHKAYEVESFEFMYKRNHHTTLSRKESTKRNVQGSPTMEDIGKNVYPPSLRSNSFSLGGYDGDHHGSPSWGIAMITMLN